VYAFKDGHVQIELFFRIEGVGIHDQYSCLCANPQENEAHEGSEVLAVLTHVVEVDVVELDGVGEVIRVGVV